MATVIGLPDLHAQLNVNESRFVETYRAMLLCLNIATETCRHSAAAGELPTGVPQQESPPPIRFAWQAETQLNLSPFPLTRTTPVALKAIELAGSTFEVEQELHEAIESASPRSITVDLAPLRAAS